MKGATKKENKHIVLTLAESKALRKVLLSDAFQRLIGAEEWDLTEVEENVLWEIIKREGS